MSSRQRPTIGLVDPVRTSKAFVPELRRRHVDLVVIESGMMGALRGDYDAVTATSLPAMAGQLRRLGVTQIIGCVDPSITYADRLSAELGLKFNGLRLSEARRNKALMLEAVRAAGLRTPACLETDHEDALVHWLATASFPVIVKPASSGGSDNVHLCNSLDEALAALHRIIGRRNLMGTLNTTVLVQEYIDGTEYAIDSVSFDGVHVVVDVFEYQKGVHNSRAFVYEKERFLRFEDPRTSRLREFAVRALDALEFRVGASHMEIKINSNDELVFIEVGARLSGGDTFKIVRDTRSDGKSQLDFAIDAALEAPPPAARYGTARDGIRVYIISDGEGRLRGLRRLDEIQRLPSYTRMQLDVEMGAVVSRTIDMSTGIGWIDLTHADADALERDEMRLDEILREGVLELESST